MTRRISLSLALMLNLAVATAAGAQTYTIQELGTLGGAQSEARAVNVHGAVVGQAQTPSGAYHAFLWQNGTMTDLGSLGGAGSAAWDINDAGQIVGTAQTSTGAYHGFLWQDGVMADLGTLGGSGSGAGAINAAGQIVGGAQTPAGDYHAFLWQDGVMTDLRTLGGGYSTASGINNATPPQVVGSSTTAAGGSEAFVWSGGVMTSLGLAGGESSHANAINDAGQVVGHHWIRYFDRTFGEWIDAPIPTLWESGRATDLYWDGYGYGINAASQVVGAWAFLWQNGVVQDLNALIGDRRGLILYEPFDISDAGQIAGIASREDDSRLVACLLTPSRLPSTYRVSGTVTEGITGLAGVLVSIGTQSATTDAAGRYTITGLVSGNYTVTAALAEYTLSPASRSITLGPDQSGIDFAATRNTYSIEGTVREGASGLAGVTVSAGSASATTDERGDYRIIGLRRGSYTLVPRKVPYTFGPSQAVVSVGPDRDGVDFTARAEPPRPVALRALTVTPQTVRGGASATGTVMLTGPAPFSGVVVSLTSSNPRAASAPLSVTVPAGVTTARFTVTTRRVTRLTTAALTARSGSVSKTATLTVTR